LNIQRSNVKNKSIKKTDSVSKMSGAVFFAEQYLEAKRFSPNVSGMSTQEKIADHSALLEENPEGLLLERYFSEIIAQHDPDMQDLAQYFQDAISQQSNNSVTSTLYTFSNERLKNLFKSIKVTGKRVATVGSSGDQALCAIFHGARTVDIIDLNPYTKVFVDLKIAAIKGLTYEEFQSFALTLPHIFTKRESIWTYQYISHLLPPDSQMFWDEIMLNVGVDQNEVHLFKRNMFHIYLTDIYSNERNFNKLKQILTDGQYDLNIINAELGQFPKRLKGKYDLILLSNIDDYCSGKTKHRVFERVVRSLYENHLNPSGIIQLSSNVNGLKSSVEELCSIFVDLENSKSVKFFKLANSGLWNADSLCIKKPKQKRMSLEKGK